MVVVDHTAEPGGAEVALVRLLRALDREQADVRVVLFSAGPLVAELRGAGVPVRVMPLAADVTSVDRYTAGHASWANLVRAVRTVPFVVRLAWLLRRCGADLVVTTSLKADLLGGTAARLAGRRLVWHLHDRIAEDYLPGAMVRLVQAASRVLPHLVIANSAATAQTVPVRCEVVPPPIDPAWVLDPAAVAARPGPGEHPVVGLVGRISPTKGQREFVRAAAMVAVDHRRAQFRIIGSPMFGAEEYAAQVRAEQAQAEHDGALAPGQVHWTGFVTDPRAELDGLDVLVHASPVPEPFGQVIVEAMVRGVPVVATRAGGAVQIVAPDDEDPLGVLVAPGDARALADAITLVLDDPDAARTCAHAARTSAARRFDAASAAARVTSVWNRATSAHTGTIWTDRAAGWSL